MTSPEDLRHWLRYRHAPDWIELAFHRACYRCIFKGPGRRVRALAIVRATLVPT